MNFRFSIADFRLPISRGGVVIYIARDVVGALLTIENSRNRESKITDTGP